MSPLILLLLALAVAVVLQAFVRAFIAPRRRWVAVGRPRIAMAQRRSISRHGAMARRIAARERGTETSDWENEGGAVAAGAPVEVATPASRNLHE